MEKVQNLTKIPRHIFIRFNDMAMEEVEGKQKKVTCVVNSLFICSPPWRCVK